jgi:SET domain-containing protein
VYHRLLKMPPGLRIMSSSIDNQWGICVTKPFAKGDVIFENHAVFLSQPPGERAEERGLLVLSCPDPSWDLEVGDTIKDATLIADGVVAVKDGAYMYTRPPLATRTLDWLYFTEIRSRSAEKWTYEYFSFDSFCNHGCSPSGEMIYDDNILSAAEAKMDPQTCHVMRNGRIELHGKGTFDNLSALPSETKESMILLGRDAKPVEGRHAYRMVATTDLAAGDEVTCDYSKLLGPEVGYTIEECKCGSEQCRGRVFC